MTNDFIISKSASTTTMSTGKFSNWSIKKKEKVFDHYRKKGRKNKNAVKVL